MVVIEEVIHAPRGTCIADMSKYDLDRYINSICEQFMANGAIEWEKESIFTKELLFDHIKRFNDDRLGHGWTSLTPTDLEEIQKKLFDAYSILPSNQIEILEKTVEVAYRKTLEELANIRHQLENLKKKEIILEKSNAKKLKKGGK